MITDAFLNWVLSLAQGAWALVPPWEVTPDTNTLQEGLTFMAALDGFLPVSELRVVLVSVVVLVVAWVHGKWFVKLVDWIRG